MCTGNERGESYRYNIHLSFQIKQQAKYVFKWKSLTPVNEASDPRSLLLTKISASASSKSIQMISFVVSDHVSYSIEHLFPSCHFQIRFLLFCILLRTRLHGRVLAFTYYTDDSHVTVLFFLSLCMTFGFLSDKSKWKSANHLKLNLHWPLHPSEKEPRLLQPILCLFTVDWTWHR